MTCPRPDKIKHATEAGALAAIRSLRKAGRGTPEDEAYPCGDHWHVGRLGAKYAARIRRSLKPGRDMNSIYRRRAR